MVVVIQALVILFTGALDNMVRMPMQAFFLSLRRRREAGQAQSPAE
jgi:simple sugar transport system permease protein